MQMELLQQQWEGTSSALEAVQQEERRLKRHLVKLASSMEVRCSNCRLLLLLLHGTSLLRMHVAQVLLAAAACVLQEMQRASQQAVTSEVALAAARNDIQQLSAAQQQLSTRLEVHSSATAAAMHCAACMCCQQHAPTRSRSHACHAMPASAGDCHGGGRAHAAAGAGAPGAGAAGRPPDCSHLRHG